MTRPSLSRLLLLLGFGLAVVGCDVFDVDDIQDPNGPSLGDVLEDPTRDKIANVAAGIEAGARIDISLYLIDAGVVGREFYRFSGSDPRFTTELLGKGNEQLDNNTFYISRPWAARYRVVRNAHIMLQAVELTEFYDDAEKAAARGYAKTWIAHELLLNLNLTHDNGVRTDVADFENLGPIVNPAEAALEDIAALLDEAAADLAAAGGEDLPFSTTIDNVGAIDFGTAASFRTFNRALAARVAAYREQFGAVLTALDESFFDPDGALAAGAYYVFSTGAGDEGNLMYYPVDASASEIIVAHPSFVDDAEEGDRRVFGDEAEVALHLDSEGEPSAVTVDGLTGEYTFVRYESIEAPIPIIRNAELVLLQAEALAQTGDVPGAIDAVNTVRNAAGLDDYNGAATPDAVIDEILRQRRYELFGEGHYWIDARRYDRLDTLPIDRSGDDVWTQFPVPFSENI